VGELIEWEAVDAITAGAVGVPGRRVFMIQARRGTDTLSVLVEKDQVAILAEEANALVERLSEDDSTAGSEQAEQIETHDPIGGGPLEEATPLFRARLIGLGYDPERRVVLIELRESPVEDGELPPAVEECDGFVVRLHATCRQVVMMTASGAEAVAAGRPTCSLCGFPMDPDGHPCPRWN